VTDIVGGGMSDKPQLSNIDLRTRIEAILWDNWEPTAPSGSFAAMADAVISELGLRRASRPNDYDHVDYPPGDRYITDWIVGE